MFSRYRFDIKEMVAIILIVATIPASCGNKLSSTDLVDPASAPSQQIANMYATQTENGKMKMRMEAPTMKKYTIDKNESYEDFPDGFQVFGYNDQELLETEIISNQARHTIKGNDEKWSAYGNVVITNFIKGEKIETDTLYWDQAKKMIFTDCYVKLSSPQGFMQGYGLESDEMARNAILLRPFDSYGIVSNDSTRVGYVDTANFIGPLYKNIN